MVKGQKILNATVVVFLTLSSLSIGFIVGVGVNNPTVVRTQYERPETATEPTEGVTAREFNQSMRTGALVMVDRPVCERLEGKLWCGYMNQFNSEDSFNQDNKLINVAVKAREKASE